MTAKKTPTGLDLWNKLEVTDTAYTKKFDKGNFKGTAVDPIYNIKRVTEQLGPVGFAWGWHVVREELIKFDAEGADPQWIHNAVLRVWFRQEDGSTREVEHIGSTIAARFVGRGPNRRFMVDDEYAKKSITDALSKVLVHLGASADIWLGRFDGNKYVPPPPQETPRGTPAERDERLGPEPPSHPDTDLAAEAHACLHAVPDMDEVDLVDARDWLRSPAPGGGGTVWAALGRIDRAARGQLATAIEARAVDLKVNLHPDRDPPRGGSEPPVPPATESPPPSSEFSPSAEAPSIADEARARLAMLPSAPEGTVRAIHAWLHGRADDNPGNPSRWALLGKADKALRAELNDTLKARAGFLGVALDPPRGPAVSPDSADRPRTRPMTPREEVERALARTAGSTDLPPPGAAEPELGAAPDAGAVRVAVPDKALAALVDDARRLATKLDDASVTVGVLEAARAWLEKGCPGASDPQASRWKVLGDRRPVERQRLLRALENAGQRLSVDPWAAASDAARSAR